MDGWIPSSKTWRYLHGFSPVWEMDCVCLVMDDGMVVGRLTLPWLDSSLVLKIAVLGALHARGVVNPPPNKHYRVPNKPDLA